MCSNSGAMGVRRVWSNTENEPPHETEMALGRTSDLGMGRCVCFLDDVHGPLEHERPPSSSLQGPCALILGQPPSGSSISHGDSFEIGENVYGTTAWQNSG